MARSMSSKIILLLAIFAVSCDAAALVRFINTVPTRTVLTTLSSGVFHIGNIDVASTIDRVGLQYFADNGANTLNSPTIVWTETLNDKAASVSTGTAPYAWAFAMPPLRRYSLVHNTAYPAAVDRVSAYLSSQIASGLNPAQTDPSVTDNYDHTFLKGDGVGLYLSFAAGTYRTQAYGVLGGTLSAAYTGAAKAFASSLTSFTFADNTVYTIVAIGNGNFASTPSMSGATVTLKMFIERVDPTTFGKASLRYFHAIQTQSTNTLEFYNGENPTNADQLASGLAFGTFSDYVDVAPNNNMVVSITQTGSTSVIAPSSSGKQVVTADVRAGLRATVICAVTDSQNSIIFCRMIPSRVVAYVRMVNDLQGEQSLVQGAFGATKLSMSMLSLYASYETPSPDQIVDMSQNTANRRTGNHPGFTRGLYGVLSKVSSGAVTGYGEVFVPIPIMDFALRFTIVFDLPTELNDQFSSLNNGNAAVVPNVASYVSGNQVLSNANRRDNQQNPTAGQTGAHQQWFWGAPIFKRVNFVVKTEGFSTLSGNAIRTVRSAPVPAAPVTIPDYAWVDNGVLLDEYMEPGQYYTLIATPQAYNAIGNLPYSPSQIQIGRVVRYFWRLDKTIDQISSGIPSGQARIQFLSFAEQTFATATTGTLTLRGKSSNSQQTNIILNAASTYAVLADRANVNWVWNTPSAGTQVQAGNFRFDYVPGNDGVAPAGVSNLCLARIPSPTDVTLNAGDNVDVFVLNAFGCVVANNDFNQLSSAIVITESAIKTGHANATLLADAAGDNNNQVFFAAAPATSASFTLIVLFISAILALLF
jgi:hypothetical protein